MTPQQIVGLAVRLFAIWLLIMSLQMFSLASMATANDESATMAAMYMFPLLCIVLAVLLWMFPMAVAHKLVPRTMHDNVLSLPAKEAVAAGSAILGLWTIISLLPRLASMTAMVIAMSRQNFGMDVLGPKTEMQYIANLIQLGIGIYLVCKPWALADKVFPSKP